MQKVLVTGGAGFLGSILLNHLLKQGFHCVSVDLQPHSLSHPNLIALQGDMGDTSLLNDIFKQHSFVSIFHCAALLAHGHIHKKRIWESNTVATKHLVNTAIAHRVPQIIFTSTNCLWGKNFHRPVKEEDLPEPVEIYGASKAEAEKILLAQQDKINVVIFRCPTIIDAGRLGLLSILFEFIQEGRKIYVVGEGNNRYQFIYAKDLINAMIKSLSYPSSAIFNIGSDDVKTLYDVFFSVIQHAKTGASIVKLPKTLTLGLMKMAYHLKISPLGPYHYKMIAEDFIFDTQKIKTALNWQPTLKNEDMLLESYQYYTAHLSEILQARAVSAHKKPAKMGIIRLLKWLS